MSERSVISYHVHFHVVTDQTFFPRHPTDVGSNDDQLPSTLFDFLVISFLVLGALVSAVAVLVSNEDRIVRFSCIRLPNPCSIRKIARNIGVRSTIGLVFHASPKNICNDIERAKKIR